MRTFVVAVLLMTLAGCGSNGSTSTEKSTQTVQVAATPTVAATPDNGADSMASNDAAPAVKYPDPEQRPIMQAQVVLDRQGFGPGVIDGKMGLSTKHALQGFQEARGLKVSGTLDDATKQALQQWSTVPGTRVVRIPQDWGERTYQKIPADPSQQAQMQRLGYESLDERLAERFHTTAEVLKQLNPGGKPAGVSAADLAGGGIATAQGNAREAQQTAASPTPSASPSSSPSPTQAPSATGGSQSLFTAGQLVRVPNIGNDRIDPNVVEDKTWQATLASLGVGTDQPHVTKVVVSKSGGWLKAYDGEGKLVAEFTVTSGSSHDPLPLGTWGIKAIVHNPYFSYNPKLLWDVPDSDAQQKLPPGPNGPVGVVWIALTKPHYGIHGTPDPELIGRTQSHGCVRLTNWDAARLAQMVDTSTKVVFQA